MTSATRFSARVGEQASASRATARMADRINNIFARKTEPSVSGTVYYLESEAQRQYGRESPCQTFGFAYQAGGFTKLGLGTPLLTNVVTLAMLGGLSELYGCRFPAADLFVVWIALMTNSVVRHVDDVRCWHEADILSEPHHVHLRSNSGLHIESSALPLLTQNGHRGLGACNAS